VHPAPNSPSSPAPATAARDRKTSITRSARSFPRAVASDQVIDIFAAAGMQQPNIAILSDEFLAEVKGMKQRNLALEMLKKLLNDEIKARSKKNLVQSRSFAEMLEKSIRQYQKPQHRRRPSDCAPRPNSRKTCGKPTNAVKTWGMTDDELAFYDALEVNDSAVKVLGEPTLRDISPREPRRWRSAKKRNHRLDQSRRAWRAKLPRAGENASSRSTGYPPG